MKIAKAGEKTATVKTSGRRTSCAQCEDFFALLLITAQLPTASQSLLITAQLPVTPQSLRRLSDLSFGYAA